MTVLYDNPRAVPVLASVGQIPEEEEPEEGDKPQPDFFKETVPAAFRLENTVGSFLSREDTTSALDEDFDPFSDIAGYDPERFVDANSPEDVATVKRQIDRENEDRKTLAESGWLGTAAAFTAGIADPINFIPVGGASYRTYRTGRSILEGGLTTARAGLLSSTAAEVLLHHTQEMRTYGESAANIAASTLLSGLIGASVPAVKSFMKKNQTGVADDVTERLAEDFDIPDDDPVMPGFAKIANDDLEFDTGFRAAGAASVVDAPPTRTAWEDSFPGVTTHTSEKARNSHPDYAAAKEGNEPAADRLAADLLDETVVARIAEEIGDRKPIIVPVRAFEAEGINEIPEAMAEMLSKQLDLDYQTDIVQRNIVRHTKAKAHDRITKQAIFDGKVEAGRDYYIVDDHLGLGGTLASLKGHIEAKGGRVIGATTLTSSRNNNILGLKSATLEELRTRYGKELEDWWQDRFGHTFEELTEPEGQWLLRGTDADGVRSRLTQVESSSPGKKDRDPSGGDEGGGLDGSGTPDIPTGGDGGSIGAAAVRDTTLAEEGLKSALGVEKAIKFQDPLLRTVTSPSIATRRTIQELAESPLAYEKNSLGIETPIAVETLVKMHQAPLAKTLAKMDNLYIQYRLGRGKRFGDIPVQAVKDSARLSNDRKLTFAEFKEQVGRAMINGDQHDIPQVAAAAKEFRSNVFDPLKDEAVKLDLLPEDLEVQTAPSYLMRKYNVEKIIARRNKFEDITTKWLMAERDAGRSNADFDDLELRDIAEQITDRIIGTPDGRLPYDVTVDSPRSGGGKQRPDVRGPLKGRSFLIPDRHIADFLEMDIEVVSRAYMRTMAPDVELTKKFGSADMVEQIDTIRRDYVAKTRAAKTERDRKKLHKKRDADIKDISAVRDRIRGTFALPQDPTSVAVRLGRGVRTFNYIRLLGGMTVSAFPDVARTAMVHGLGRSFGDGIVPMARNFKKFKLAANEVKEAGTALDMILDSRAMAIADVMDDFGRYSKLERGVKALGDKFGTVSLMAPWNAAMKQFAGIVTQSHVLKAAKAAQGGKVSKKELEALAASGINQEMAKRIAGQFDKFGGVHNGVRLANTLEWTDAEAVKHFRAAIVRDVDRIIVTPGQDKPLWLSREWGKLLGQFKSFSMASSQRVFLAGLQQRDMAALNGALLSVGLGAMVYAFKNWDAGRELSDDPAVWLKEGIDRSGLTGWFFEANNIVEKAFRGQVGVSKLMGGPPMSRYASRNLTGAVLGPTSGMIEDAATVVGDFAADEWTKRDTTALRRLLPYQNLIGFRRLLDQAETGLNETLGVGR